MNMPLLTWCCVAGLVAVVLIIRLVHAAYICAKGKHRFFQLGSEREEFYIPGDRIKIDDYDYADFEDL